MKTQLVLLDVPIIVSDEKFTSLPKDTIYYDGEGNFRKWGTGNCYSLSAKKIIAGIPELPSIDFNGFEKELGIINLEDLAREFMSNYPLTERMFASMLSGDYTNNTNSDGYKLFLKCLTEFHTHFQKQNEKKFSLEDIRKAVEYGATMSKRMFEKKNIDDYCKEVNKPKVFDVKIEGELLWYNSRFGGCWQPFPDETATIRKFEPKIVKNSIKIIDVLWKSNSSHTA